MSATASALQIEANRANSQLSTGPKTPEGKLSSSRNAQSHGLTTRHALLPGEDQREYEIHHATYVTHYCPLDAIDQALVTEIADLNWRLRRVPAFEAQLISVEVANLTTNPDFKHLIEHLTSGAELNALAFSRLVQNKVLPNLYNLEARLARRVDKLHHRLEYSRRDRRYFLQQDLQETENRQNKANLRAAQKQQPIRVAAEPGRNEPCTCGSGLKYKRCCLEKSTINQKAQPNAGTVTPANEVSRNEING